MSMFSIMFKPGFYMSGKTQMVREHTVRNDLSGKSQRLLACH